MTGRLLDRLIHSPVREVLDEHFESPQVQAAVLGNVDLRSLDEPGDLLGWASVKPNLLVDPLNQGLVPGGMGTLATAFAGAARAAGAVIRTGAEVRRILVDDQGAACGVELVDGQAIRAGTVISNADPKRTFLRLLDPDAVGPELTARIGRLETLSGSVKLHAAVSELPDFGRYVRRSGRPAGGGHGPDRPVHRAMSRIRWPTPRTAYPRAPRSSRSRSRRCTTRPSRRPVDTSSRCGSSSSRRGSPREAGTTVRDTVHEQLIETVTGYAPNFRRSIIDSVLYTPLDMEQRVGLTDGNIHHLDHSVTQLLGDRLFPGGGYRTPIAGLYMCGAGTHPGGEVSGAPGHNAAMIVLTDIATQERSSRV